MIPKREGTRTTYHLIHGTSPVVMGSIVDVIPGGPRKQFETRRAGESVGQGGVRA